MTPPENAVSIKMVYAGVIEGKRDALWHVYYIVHKDGHLSGEQAHFKGPLIRRPGKPGVVVEGLTWTVDGEDTFGQFEAVGRWRDPEWVVEQQTRHAVLKAARSKRRERYRDLVAEQLEPLRRAYYRGRTAHERRALIAMVLEYIQRGY